MNRWILTTFSLLACAHANANDCSSSAIVFSSGVARISEPVPGAEIDVAVRTQNPESQAAGYFGLDRQVPREVVGAIEVSIEGNAVYVPRSAFADLPNPRDICLDARRGQYELRIRGGDASSAYMAALEFDSRWLKKRRVELKEFPSERWEETTYSFTTSTK